MSPLANRPRILAWPPFARRGVGVHAFDTGAVKRAHEELLRFLCAGAEEEQRTEATFAAFFGHAALRAAVVATEVAAAGVVGEADVAVFAVGHPTALGAQDERREAAPVEQEDDLFLGGDACADLGLERARQDDFAADFFGLDAHVDEAHFGQRAARGGGWGVRAGRTWRLRS